MSGRRSNARREGESLDSLLDTMANVVGILVMLVAVAQLSMGNALERIAEDAVPVELSPARVEAAEQQTQEVEDAIVRLRGELAALPVTARREGLLLMEAESALDELEALAGADRLEGGSAESLSARLREQSTRVETLEYERMQVEQKVTKLNVLLKEIPAETRPKIARLPDPRPPPKGKEPLVFLARYGRVVPVDGKSLVRTLYAGVDNALGPRRGRGYTSQERDWLENHFEKQRAVLGDQNFFWSLQNEGVRSFFAGLAWRTEEAGDSIGDLRVGDSSFGAELAGNSAEDRFVQFWVWPDSFETYLEARYLAEASGFDVAWSPVEGRNPVGVQLLGPRPNRVLID
ncbi:MAG: hypothetical protein CMN75_01425 [Spirochaeta sp.]|nr:hypothetical protein [Spirochaeta sp.]RPG10362.1 MAG: hypothetical protein CBC32_006530 [Proteobacteria bacterium TMED72]